MSPEPMHFSDYQAAFAARIRDPKQAPRPPGDSAKRMRVYEELLFNNLENFLLACYPITRQLLGARVWKQTLRRFFSAHRSHSPLFRDIPKAFLDWLEAGGATRFPALPFLAEFMHYEWLELSVSVSLDDPDLTAVEPEGDLLKGRPAPHPTARMACYHYPVHRIGPRFKPTVADGQVYCYLLFRDETDTVRFIQLNPLSARLLELLREQRSSGREALAHLAAQTAPDQYEKLVQAGGDLLRDLRDQGALLGTWRTP
ncbi:MAG: putative DNA-binding domain-containing protein [Pseudomonadota bacterium]|nr:putative DNA-binding domain-containing protein [Pseudomonadota bacterium]MDP1903782.1 putative DNA-binding domain-containing protein [Pseudomonadota bacterium]MDP2353723.1 putative DNA-binding domain-containing protein [Pseudomonadota bacterium]